MHLELIRELERQRLEVAAMFAEARATPSPPSARLRCLAPPPL